MKKQNKQSVSQDVSVVLKDAGKCGLYSALIGAFIADRKACDPNSSYTAYIANLGPAECVRALSVDTIRMVSEISAGAGTDVVIARGADVLYNLQILLNLYSLSLDDLNGEIVDRILDSGYKTGIFQKLVNGTLQEREATNFLMASRLPHRLKLAPAAKKPVKMNKPVKLVKKAPVPIAKPTKLKNSKVVKLKALAKPPVKLVKKESKMNKVEKVANAG